MLLEEQNFGGIRPATDWETEESWFDSRQGKEIFLFSCYL
jgi:hypothetical protein